MTDRDTSFGWHIIGTRQMEEDGTSASAAARHVVVAEHDDDIVEVVRPPHPFGTGGIRMNHPPIVVRISGRIAPAIERADATDWNAADRSRHPVAAIEDLPDFPAPDRCRTVALALADLAPSASEGAANAIPADSNNSACIARRSPADEQRPIDIDNLCAMTRLRHVLAGVFLLPSIEA